MTFRFMRRKSNKSDLEITGLFTAPTGEEEEIGLINGQKARSKLEWWAAKALWKLKREFLYQYPINGGSRKRGGILVDFLIIDGPLIALEIQGTRWHSGVFKANERIREAMIRQVFNITPVYVWEEEMKTESDAFIAVKRAISG